MRSKSNKAFSLLEVIITVAILSTAIVFIFRAFITVLSSVRFSQNITLACLLAEDKLWEIEEKQKKSVAAIDSEQGKVELQGNKFNWDYKTSLEDSGLIKLDFNVSWQEKARENEHTMTFITYLLPGK